MSIAVCVHHQGCVRAFGWNNKVIAFLTLCINIFQGSTQTSGQRRTRPTPSLFNVTEACISMTRDRDVVSSQQGGLDVVLGSAQHAALVWGELTCSFVRQGLCAESHESSGTPSRRRYPPWTAEDSGVGQSGRERTYSCFTIKMCYYFYLFLLKGCISDSRPKHKLSNNQIFPHNPLAARPLLWLVGSIMVWCGW